MSLSESPKITVSRFSKSWGETNQNSLLSEFISIARETNREPDSYCFTVGKDSLIDPDTERPILDFIAEGDEKDVARNLQKWALEKDEGIALWISAKKEGLYPCPKIIIHRIAYTPDGGKVLLNSVILFDSEINNPEYKRKTLYTLPDSENNIFKILGWIKRISNEEVNFEASEKTTYLQAKHFVEEIQAGIPSHIVINEMQKTGFLGQNSISCPTFGSFIDSRASVSAFGVSKDRYGSLQFSCPHCHGVNLRPRGQLINSCQHCGKDVRC